MAQGKLKVKTSKPGGKNNKSGNHKVSKHAGRVAKRGQRNIAPKKASQQELHRIKKTITKGINKNIEEVIAQRAHQVEEGKNFNVLPTPSTSSGKGKKGAKK